MTEKFFLHFIFISRKNMCARAEKGGPRCTVSKEGPVKCLPVLAELRTPHSQKKNKILVSIRASSPVLSRDSQWKNKKLVFNSMPVISREKAALLSILEIPIFLFFKILLSREIPKRRLSSFLRSSAFWQKRRFSNHLAW